jgi:CheY-like chemotaxis protein
MQKSNIESRGVNFELKTDISEPWIIGDEILIKRVLMNIVSNAAKFTDPGGKITLSVSQQKDDADHVATFFCCEDTGRGMSEEFLTHIWDSFSQERHNNENSGGTGLGMTISKLITEEMGGDITVKSKLGEGSTFTVVLHSEIASAPVPAANISEEASSSPEEKRLKILLAEDNELNAEILTEILKGEGFKVVHAENGKTAVEKFENSPAGEFDIILMDMQMPVMDGCTATRTIRKLERADAQTVPIFACTANSFTEDRNRAIASGMNDFLSKPIDVNEMLTKISAIASPGSVGSVGE